MGSNCGYDFFMVLGTIGKSPMSFFVLDMIFLWLWICFFNGFGYVFLRFFYGFGNGFGQNRKNNRKFLEFLAKKTIL
jgi:hypothetical protein